ncbi:MAG: hypothetical protein LBS01_10130 [Prevotellaceae bacterium]|nr:hypothetical protein [Prevotellaceae bacterium]
MRGRECRSQESEIVVESIIQSSFSHSFCSSVMLIFLSKKMFSGQQKNYHFGGTSFAPLAVKYLYRKERKEDTQGTQRN